MKKLTKIQIAAAVAAGAAAAAVAGLTLPSAFAGDAPRYTQAIYRVTVTAPNKAGDLADTPEWVSLTSGTWRAEVEDQAFISSPDDYVVIDQESGSVYHRTGSPSFMSDLHTPPEGVVALRAYLKGDQALAQRGLHLGVGRNNAGKTTLDALDDAGKLAFRTTIEQRVSDQDADAAHLLDATPVQPQVTDVELPVGKKPSGDLDAYWFGAAVANVHAATAAQHALTRTPAQTAAGMSPRAEGETYATFYERPGTRQTSAEPTTLSRPDGELQVVSEPVSSPHAQGLIAAFDGQNGDETYPAWPRTTVTLASGEQATVVPNQFDGADPVRPGFFVITDSTLVTVSGDVAEAEIPGLAAKLKALR
jgi:hypothetical protein